MGFEIAVDDYVTGATVSADFPTVPIAFKTTSNGIGDVFETKGLFLRCFGLFALKWSVMAVDEKRMIIRKDEGDI